MPKQKDNDINAPQEWRDGLDNMSVPLKKGD